MIKNYICQNCNIEFEQKSNYDRHMNKKISCVLKNKSIKNDAILKIIKEDIKNN